jgi:hypothetical protein
MGKGTLVNFRADYPRSRFSRTIEREPAMRRLLFSLLAMSFMGAFAGCHATHGVCDCTGDFDDHCAYRAPWLAEGSGSGPAPGPAAAPEKAPLPEIREALPSTSKKL